MKKGIMRALSALLLLVLIAGLSSCADEAAVTTMRITLDPSMDTRSIVPDGLNLDVVKYKIDGKGPGNAVFNVTTTRHQTTLEGLPIGEWTVKATGLNRDGIALVEGTRTFTLSSASQSVVIQVNKLIGQGSLSATLNWKEKVLVDPKVKITLTPQRGGEAITEEPVIQSSSVTFRRDELPSGSYLLQAQLFSGKFLIAGLTEAVRIADGMTSAKTLTFDMDEFPYSPGSLQLYDSTGAPINCVIEGLSAEIESGKTTMLSLKPDAPGENEIEARWYLDGAEIGTGETCMLKAEPGMHRLDAVAYTDKLGSYGSASVSFEAVVKTAPGVPGNGKVYSTFDGLKLGANTVVTYADNSLLIASGDHHSIQVVDMIRNSASIIDEVGVDTVPVLDAAPVAMGVSPAPIASDGTYGVVITLRNTPKTAKLNFDVTTRALSFVEETGPVEQLLNAKKVTVLDWVSRKLEWCSADNTLVTLDWNETRVQEGDIHNTSSLVARKVSKKTAEKRFPWVSFDVDYRFNQANPGENMRNATSFAYKKDAEFVLAGNRDGLITKTRTVYGGFAPTLDVFEKTSLVQSKYKNTIDMRFADAEFAYIMGPGFIGVYDAAKNLEVQYISLDAALEAIAINDVTGTLYAVDARNQKLYSWKIGVDGRLSGQTEVKTQGGYDNIVVSQDGERVAIWNQVRASGIEIFRVKTK